jgi:hypothetical protein
MYWCNEFVHVPTDKRQALDDHSQECILIAYGSGNISSLLTKRTREIVIARDVKFDATLLGSGDFRDSEMYRTNCFKIL